MSNLSPIIQYCTQRISNSANLRKTVHENHNFSQSWKNLNKNH